MHHFEFFVFHLEIVISDLKNSVIFISVQFDKKTSNLVKKGLHLETTILNFLILTAESELLFHANEKCVPERIKIKPDLFQITRAQNNLAIEGL